MSSEDLEERMRAREIFSPARLLPGAWAILRVDGRGFSRFTEGRFEKARRGRPMCLPLFRRSAQTRAHTWVRPYIGLGENA